ncbi:acyltransferase 3 [Burkholderia sp. lig30]|jgi:peptidoglycan/LPS O-acetylase OafA/YrhL|uniref:acyltransferase family protein n=1 Tax=Burkholderia sp. lig30 TaxID=1192124 RepID=UPI000460A849|nr:acyltransferase [Burkholderia sp. lig30]KDB09699.1 acyltransferase 3 [Burkholderia sp. lig30]
MKAVYSSPASPALQSGKFMKLEGLRGILCLSVAMGHYGVENIFHRVGLGLNFSYAVNVFFVISGFVLAHSNYYGSKSVGLYEFSVKRFARLYPLHIASLLLAVAVYFASGREINWIIFAQNIFLVQNIGLNPNLYSFNFPSWSVSVEFWCSIIFFVVTRVFAARELFVITALLVGVASIFFMNIVRTYPPANVALGLNAGLLNGLVGFALGICVYHVTSIPICKRVLSGKWAGWFACIGLVLFFVVDISPRWSFTFYCFAALAVAVAACRSTENGLLNARPILWLGKISFSIYLIHIPMALAAGYLFGEASIKGSAGKFVLLSAVIVASTMTYRIFEMSCQWKLRGWLLRPRGAPVDAS